jgi:uncharacterized protein YndB with AHSA1/START domain/DNA-binding transcriptional ArsR family regulator
MDAVMRALAEPHRRQILWLVRDRELAAGSIATHFRITRPAVSQHLSVLKQAGLVAESRAGARRLYRADPKALAALRVFVEDFHDQGLRRLMAEAGVGVERTPGDERVAVERDITIAAEPEVVWKLLIDPDQVRQWMGIKANFDARPGGRYEVEVLPGFLAAGEFLEIDPPRRLVHTWGWELARGSRVPPGSTIVVIELLAQGGGTRLRLDHRDLPGIAPAGSHSRGWAHYLARLADVATGRGAGPDPWVTEPARMLGELRPASGGSPDNESQRKGGQ